MILSVEAKFRTMAHRSYELLCARSLVKEFGIPTGQIFYDNRVAVSIASNPMFHEKTKHVELDCPIIPLVALMHSLYQIWR